MVAGDPETLTQLAGVTGIGWTVSMTGYLVTVTGAGGGQLSWLAVDPQSLLLLGAACLVATVGLDRLREARSAEES